MQYWINDGKALSAFFNIQYLYSCWILSFCIQCNFSLQYYFSDEYNTIVQKEAVEKAHKAAKQKELDDAQLHAKSFVEYLNTRAFFDSLFADDPEGNAFLEIGEEMAELYVDFEENVIAECKSIFVMGQEQYDLRQIEIDNYTASVQNAKLENQKRSIVSIYFIFLTKGYLDIENQGCT